MRSACTLGAETGNDDVLFCFAATASSDGPNFNAAATSTIQTTIISRGQRATKRAHFSSNSSIISVLLISYTGEPVALTAQRLRRFAEVLFCAGWVDGRWPSTQPAQKRTHEPRSGEQSQKGIRQRYLLCDNATELLSRSFSQ